MRRLLVPTLLFCLLTVGLFLAARAPFAREARGAAPDLRQGSPREGSLRDTLQERLPRRQPPPPPPPVERSVVLIMFDGTAWDAVARLYEAGRLPGLQDLVQRKRGRLFRTITTFPSATAPSLPELLVGRYADRANADFLRHVQEFFRDSGRIKRYAFDRASWDSSDLDLFDLVKAAGKESWAFAMSEYEGAEKNSFDPFFYQMEFLTGYTRLPATNYDRRVFDKLIEALSSRPTLPDFTFLELDLVDIAGHAYGPKTEQYERMIREEDQDIARLVTLLASRPHPSGGSLLDHTDFYVFGDHGMASTDVRLDLPDHLRRLGMKVSDGSDLPALVKASVNHRWHDAYDMLVLAVGSNGADVHVRPRRSQASLGAWTARPNLALLRALPLRTLPGTMDLVSFLQGFPGVDHLLLPEAPGRVRVMASGGAEALILSETPPGGSVATHPRRSAYEVLRVDAAGRDPFGYLLDERARALVSLPGQGEPTFHDEGEWMGATAWTEYPFAPAHVPKAFTEGPTTPDLTVNLRDGFSCLMLMRGDHGSLSRDSVSSFLVAAGPDLSAFPEQGPVTVRLIDVHAEIRATLGLPPDALTDSRGLGGGPWAPAPTSANAR